MKRNIIITATGIYHPEKIVDNDFFVKFYSEIDETLGSRVSNLLKKIGRDKRYIADFPKENALTMAAAAGMEAIKNAGLDPLELDGVIFSSDTPEYVSPCNAIMLSDMLGITSTGMVYDLNASCVGMVVAVDQVRAIMAANPRLKKVLVVGSSMLHHYGIKEIDPISYATIGDAATAVILEAVESEEKFGFIDSVYATRTNLKDHVLMPRCMMSNIYDPNIPLEEKRLHWTPFDTEEPEERLAGTSKQVLNDNNLQISDMKMLFLTQFSLAALTGAAEKLGFPLERAKYIGDIYGYTGTSSPFLAYHHAMLDGDLQTGDAVVFCSGGSGITIASSLYILV